MSSADVQAGYEVAVVTSEEGFRELRQPWDHLLARCSDATPFQTFEWQWSWWSTVGRSQRLFIVTVGEPGGALVAIAPFVVTRRNGLRIMELLGTGLSDYLDVIVADSAGDSVRLMFDAVLRDRGWDVACLQTPDASKACAEAFRRVESDPELITDHRLYEIAPFLRISETWDVFVGGKSKKFRYSIRERLNRFTAAEESSFGRILGSDVTAALAEAMWEVEKQSWKSRAGTAMMDSILVRDFYRLILTEFGRRNWAQVWLASMGKRTVAYLVTFVFRGRTYLYTLSFDAEFGKLAPGMLLLQESIRTAFEENALEYDFLCGDEPYKERWAQENRRILQILLVRRTLRARLGALIAYRARWSLARSQGLRAFRARLIGWQSRFRRENRKS